MAIAVLTAFLTANVSAQDTTTPISSAPPPETPAMNPAPPLSPADTQVLQLVQAKIGDGTIITYIQNSGTIYGLDPAQIVYLKQLGVSEPVINAMLNQRTAVAAQAQANNAANPAQPPPTTTATVAQPTTPPPAPSTTYIVPDSQAYDYAQWAAPYEYPYYYPYYSWPVGVYWGWPGYYGGWHGGYYGGWHGGGGFRGGFGGGFHGGGGWHR